MLLVMSGQAARIVEPDPVPYFTTHSRIEAGLKSACAVEIGGAHASRKAGHRPSAFALNLAATPFTGVSSMI